MKSRRAKLIHMVAPPPGKRSAVMAMTVGHIGEPVIPTRMAAVRAKSFGKKDAIMNRKNETTQETNNTS